jgi:hypothetical protein
MGKLLEILEINQIHGTHNNIGTDKGVEHSYLDFYENLLSPFIDEEISILELGVLYGGSSLMWHEFLPKSNITMFDISNKVHQDVWDRMDKDRYSLKIFDAFNKNNFNEIEQEYLKKFKIIIDDGPHTLPSQIFTIENYSKFLTEDGILVIEDVQSIEEANILLSFAKKLNFKSSEIVDLRPIKNRYDDLLILIRN